MTTIGLFLDDDRMPRTVFYQGLRDALQRSPRFEPDATRADVCLPAEDTTVELNWPRFGRTESAWLRGTFSRPAHDAYLERVAAAGRDVCIVNMHPGIRVPVLMRERPQVIVADLNLLAWERAANPRTISMPAPPITVATATPGARRVLASFRGADSHPCRRALSRLHDGRHIVVELVPRMHAGRIDATRGLIDGAYARLLADSVFAFVPRGDCHFSYRLLEVMSFGCIRILLSDDLVPPFDRTIDWRSLSLQVSEAQIPALPALLAGFSPGRIAAMQAAVADVYATRLAGIDRIAATLFAEIDLVRAAGPSEATATAPLSELVASFRARPHAPAESMPERVLRNGARRLHRWLGRRI